MPSAVCCALLAAATAPLAVLCAVVTLDVMLSAVCSNVDLVTYVAGMSTFSLSTSPCALEAAPAALSAALLAVTAADWAASALLAAVVAAL